MTVLKEYKEKRNFSNTPEPVAKKGTKSKAFRFVVQRHHASRLHYDFRLELGGVLKSWAVPKGPSLNPGDKRLAVHVEDHPVDYITFAGEIPKGNYGAGTVEIWDEGSFVPLDGKYKPISEAKALENIEKGEIKFEIKGKHLNGGFVLVRLKPDEKNWLLIKHRDEYATDEAYDSEEVPSIKKSKTPAKVAVRTPFTGKERKFAKFIKPMLATLKNDVFDDPEWLFEIKWDGYRAIAETGGKENRLYSRNGLSFAETFLPVFAGLDEIKIPAVIDGEIVVLNDAGRPNFQMLQQYREDPSHPIVYYVFDLLKLDGKDITGLPLIQRKELLRHLLSDVKTPVIRYCDHIMEQGTVFYSEILEMGLEGMVAKRTDSEYAIGVRSRQWLKIKNVNSKEAIIAGYTKPRGSRKHFGALILGEYNKGRLNYIGHTGTGFDDKTLKTLAAEMKPLETSNSPFTEKIKVNSPVTWLEPKLVCQVKFTEETRDGNLRHPVFMGLRKDKQAPEVEHDNDKSSEMETPDSGKATGKSGKNSDRIFRSGNDEVKLTNINKIYWPDEKITKGDMLDYYEKIAP